MDGSEIIFRFSLLRVVLQLAEPRAGRLKGPWRLDQRSSNGDRPSRRSFSAPLVGTFVIRNIIEGRVTNTEQLSAMKIGITFAAGEIWDFPKARSEATRALLAVLPCTNESMVHAWRTVFNSPWAMADDCSRQILDAVSRNRELLRVQHGGQLVDRLKELLEQSLEPERVCLVITTLLDECGDAVGDFRTAWAASAEDLIDIALTLQRLPGTSLCGLRIFERLMAGNAYQIEDVLRTLDRMWPS